VTDFAPLIALLERHARSEPAQAAAVERILALVRGRSDCLLRSCAPGHITASALVLSPDQNDCLLTHHRKLDRWLQLGGHVDGEVAVHLAALREAQEESGMQRIEFVMQDERSLAPVPLDVDVHVIPAHRSEPAHEHHDIRFLLRAAPGQSLVISEESNDLRWFPLATLAASNSPVEESVARLARKALRVLGRT